MTDFGQICGRLVGGLMSDIRGGSNLPHILGNVPRVPRITIGVNLAQFGDKWSNSKTQISKSDFDQRCGRLGLTHKCIFVTNITWSPRGGTRLYFLA